MSFGSFLSGIYHQVNPFDNGQTYGSVNPPRRKPQPGDPGYVAPTPRVVQNNQLTNVQQIKTQRPQNLFAGLNADLTLPSNAPSTTTQPKVQAQAPPSKPSIWHNIGNGLKTAGQTAVGVVSNVPEVGLAAGRAASGIVQGATQLPSLATHALTYVPRKIAGPNSGVNTALSNVNQGVDKATAVVQKPFNYVNRGLDTAAKKYEQAVPTAYAGAKVYRTEQIPLNVLAALLTLGSSTAAEGGGEAGNVSKIGQVTRFLNKPITENPDNLIARGGQAVSNRATPVVQAVNSPFKTAGNAFQRLITSRAVPGSVLEGEAGNVAGDVGNTTQIPVGTGIDVNAPPSEPVNIPVTNNNTPQRPGPFIREIGGDATGPGVMPTQEEIAARRFAGQPPGRPDVNIEDVTPRPPTEPFTLPPEQVKGLQDEVVNQYADFLKSFGEGNGTQLVPDGEKYGYGKIRTSNNYRPPGMGSGRITKQQWIDEARQQLESGKAENGHQAMFNDAANPDVQSLLAGGEQKPTEVGTPIAVKSVKGIPVTDQTVVPLDAGKPGQVKPTTSSSPVAAKSEAVAANPPVAPQIQAILDNPKQFSKRQVAAARNQLKLAKKIAQAKTDTQAVIEATPNLGPKAPGNSGFVSTGQFRKGERGNVTESASKSAEAAQGATDISKLSVQDVLSKAQQEVTDNGVMSPESTRNLKALTQSGKLSRTSPEFKAVQTEYQNSISHHARALSMADRTVRTTANSDQLTNRFVNKLLVVADTNKLTDGDIATVTNAEKAFTDARDTANALAEQFKATGAESDFKAWRAAQQQADAADRQAKITEYQVSKRVLKDNRNPEAAKAIQQAEKNAGVYSMDTIDANMLSGTGTMVRNYINTLFPRVENKLFGKVSSLAVRPLAPIGGSSRRGAKIGAQIGKDMFKADLAARKEGGIGFIRRNVTAGNTLGEKNIQATAYARGFDHYRQLLKQDGYTGSELKNRAEFMARTDPDGLVKDYESQALQANALASLTNSRKIENTLADAIQKKLSDSGIGSKGQAVGRGTAKAVTRVAVGFPTVIARSLVEGFKRLTLGIPEAGWSAVKFAKSGDKEAFAGDLAKSIQHAGTGGSLMLLGHALGKAGVISGPYPTDKAEQARWQAEGRQPDSIKIGGQWFSIPGYLGGFALPLMIGAGTASGNLKDEATVGNLWKTVLDASPVDNIQSTLDILTGNASGSVVKNAATSLARAVTPAGSFVAELAKLTNPTKADTTTKDTLHNILDQIGSGIPYVSNKISAEKPATDAYGNVIKNPNPVAVLLGAQGSEQKSGTEAVNKAQDAANQTYEQLKQAGVLDDKNLNQLIDPKIKAQIGRGEPLTPEQVTAVQKAVTKGVSPTEDNNWRQEGDYNTDKAALQTKLQLLQADPTAKPSDINHYKIQITRDDLLQGANTPYSDLKLYQDTTLSDWRAMGDPESDTYDPETYQKLWTLDERFAKAGASYKTDDPSGQKYSAKKPGTGRRGNSSATSSDFGKLQAGAGGPSVQKYQTIDASQNNMPIINQVIPNIVHKISSSG